MNGVISPALPKEAEFLALGREELVEIKQTSSTGNDEHLPDVRLIWRREMR